MKDIQEWLGHKDIQTTANIYSHLDISRKIQIAGATVGFVPGKNAGKSLDAPLELPKREKKEKPRFLKSQGI
ncbi:MAG: hypothetical protein IKM66_01470 [Clostridia bacterium]|nr:hypothetical protein [Clostridia bacterium]